MMWDRSVFADLAMIGIVRIRVKGSCEELNDVHELYASIDVEDSEQGKVPPCFSGA